MRNGAVRVTRPKMSLIIGPKQLTISSSPTLNGKKQDFDKKPRKDWRRRRDETVSKRPTMKMLRWKVLFLLAAPAFRCALVNSQAPTPPPTLFQGGYDFTDCAIDIFLSDDNGDGFISRNEEYLGLINRIGSNFCFSQTTPLTATQQGAYFRLVCDLIPDCRFTSEIPVGGLTTTQLLQICTETRASIFTTCPDPSPTPPSPSAPSPTPPSPTLPTPTLPTPNPPTPQPPSPTPPTGTGAPTQPFEPVAPGVSLQDCRNDLGSADADTNQRITRAEFVTFLKVFGSRVCYERPDTNELTDVEGPIFDRLICLATEACDGITDIVISQPTFTPSVAFTFCTVTYVAAMDRPVCTGDEKNSTITVAPTAQPVQSGTTTKAPTNAPSLLPITPRAAANSLRGWIVVSGLTTILVCALV